MDRALAVHILQEVEAGVRAVLAAGYALDGLTPEHIMMQVRPAGTYTCFAVADEDECTHE